MSKKASQIAVTFSDGTTYHIPALVIAAHRANHYFPTKDGSNHLDWKAEVDYTIETDPSELTDWMHGNMDWADVKNNATLVSTEIVDKDDEWCDTDLDILYTVSK